MREQDQPYRWYPQRGLRPASGHAPSHYLGIGDGRRGRFRGASAEPNGRFRTTVKTARTAPTAHQWAGARASRSG